MVVCFSSWGQVKLCSVFYFFNSDLAQRAKSISAYFILICIFIRGLFGPERTTGSERWAFAQGPALGRLPVGGADSVLQGLDSIHPSRGSGRSSSLRMATCDKLVPVWATRKAGALVSINFQFCSEFPKVSKSWPVFQTCRAHSGHIDFELLQHLE